MAGVLRVWFVTGEGQAREAVGTARVNDAGVVELSGFDKNERDLWTTRGVIASTRPFVRAKLEDGELFLSALAWSYGWSHRVITEANFAITPLDDLARLLPVRDDDDRKRT
jgi:hypothetical protein